LIDGAVLDGRHEWHVYQIIYVYTSAASAVAATNAVAGATKPTRVRSPALVDVLHVFHVLKVNAVVTVQSPDDASYSQFVSAAQLVASLSSAVHAKACVVKACDVESVALNITTDINDASASQSEPFHVQSPVHAALDVIASHVTVRSK
jgi:hypothetical protein